MKLMTKRKKYQRTVLTYEGVGKQPNRWIKMQKNPKESVNYLINIFIQNRGMIDPLTNQKQTTPKKEKTTKPVITEPVTNETTTKQAGDTNTIITNFRKKL